MEIRLATLADATRISVLARHLTGKYIAYEFPEEVAGRLLTSMDEPAISSYLAAGYRYHVAEENGELAGVVAMRDNRHIYHLFVAERFQGKGLARALWQAARAASLEAGNPAVFTVNSSRFAVGLYERLGFIGRGEVVDESGVIQIPMKLELG
ncbi:GNAT family N-acetyltransferase [Methyloterricola oryzae]|uniref:GNAT family N-acetyltransferase n=1 Tax=Methyloterricola oryzae TaxID=1495050 RepID=UPI0005EB2D7D|nr:GNAT family N-acetyltransferase [Methyloterricola oryzae]